MGTHGIRNTCIAALLTITAAASALNYDVLYTAAPPAIDGTVTDPEWIPASPAATGFVKHDAVSTPSDEQTQVRLLWDDSYLYVSYQAIDLQTVPGASADDVFTFTGADVAHLYFDPSWRQHANTASRFYRISVDPAPSAFTYTEAGLGELDWNLSGDSQFAVSSDVAGWTVEGRIAWSDFNSTGANSPGILPFAPQHNTVWGAQFGRNHSTDIVPNNAEMSKWHPTAGEFHIRALGTITFKGGPIATKVDISTGSITSITDFEAPTYVAGETVSGIDGFSSTVPNVFTTSADEASSGSQSLRISAANPAQTLFQDAPYVTASPQYVQYALRLPLQQATSGSYRHVLYLYGETAEATTSQLGQIWFRNNINDGSNIMSVVSYENPENDTAGTSTHYPGIQAYDTWNYLTVKTDPATKKFNVWLNDRKLTRANGSDMFGWRTPSALLQLARIQMYSKNYGSAPVYVDELTHVVEAPLSHVSDWQLY